MAEIKDRDTRLGLDDVLKFAKTTAANADEGVLELDKFTKERQKKQEELGKEDVSDYELDVEEKLALIRKKNKLREEIKQLEKNIEVVRERTLTLERACDVDQAVASWLLDEEVNYRKQPRLADVGDIDFEIKELKARLIPGVRNKARARDFRRFFTWKRIGLFLLLLLLILLLIFLLLRSCMKVKDVPTIAVQPIEAFSIPKPEINLDAAFDSLSDEWKEQSDEIVKIPYKEPDIPLDPIAIDYYLLQGDEEHGYAVVDGTTMFDVDKDRLYSTDDLLSLFAGEELEDESAPLPSAQEMMLEQEEAKGKKLAAGDDYYDIDILNDVAPRKKEEEKKKKEEKLAPSDAFYDILIANEARPEDYAYDILILNDVAPKKKEEEKTKDEVLEELVGDLFYDIAILNDVAPKKPAPLVAATDDFYDILIANAIEPAAEDSVSDTITKIASMLAPEEKAADLAAPLAAQQTASEMLAMPLDDENLTKLYLNYTVDNLDEEGEPEYVGEEVREGVPMDLQLYFSPYTLNAMMYPYKYIRGGESNEGTDVLLGKYACALSVGLRYRLVNDDAFKFFLGLRTGYMYSFTPNMTNLPALFELGVGVFGFEFYVGVGAIFSGMYNHNIGLGLDLGVTYSISLMDHLSFDIGANVMFGMGTDDSDDRSEGGGILIDTKTLNVNPYIGIKFSFDSVKTKYYNDEDPKIARNYTIIPEEKKK